MSLEEKLVKADIYARLSFIGLVVPILGIIFSSIANSILMSFSTVQSDEEIAKAEHVQKLQKIGMFLSVVFLIIETIVLIKLWRIVTV